MKKIGRNDQCHCGSGKKYKTCCLARDASQAANAPSLQSSAALLQIAVQQHRGGALAQAEAIYLQVLRAEPQNADALHLRGLISHQLGDLESAVGFIEKAIEALPTRPGFYNSLGSALNDQGRLEEAVHSFRQALKIKPEHAGTTFNLGNALRDQGQLDQAADCYRQALLIQPDYAEASLNLGNVLKDQGRLDAAIDCYREALFSKPDYAAASLNLGNVLKDQGRLEQAALSFRQALALEPGFAEAYSNLGNVLKVQGRLDQALDCYRQALAIKPDFAEAHSNLGNALKEQGRANEALDCYRQALLIKPDYAEASLNLGNALKDLGRLDQAADSYRRTLAIKPDDAGAYGNLLFCLAHDEKLSPEACHAEHLGFAERFETPLRAHWLPHANERDPARRLKIGFVSGDLRNHSVANFIEPVWRSLAPARLELWAYSNYPKEDEVSRRLRRLVQHWREVSGCSDEELADTIRADGIDVLIDLSGHTAHNRMLTFARKPAPLQATWIGYPGTTGLTAIDYLICDRFIAPPGLYERYYSEQFARLPTCGSFEPFPAAPEVSELPALGNGYLTFASFNRPSKLGESVIAAWSRVLLCLPDARLVLGPVDDPALARELAQRFGSYGVAAQRLSFKATATMEVYLAWHHGVDILLDTWPYAGGTTTNHALWMGVPVVTLRGPSRAHCQSAAAMGRLGLPDWVADDVAGFVRIAVERAGELEALAALRSGMRQRWRLSPWRQGESLGRGLEAALRTMWQRWCAGLPAAHFDVPLSAIAKETDRA